MINVGVETYYYSKTDEKGNRDSDSVEKHLSKEIEQPANAIIEKIWHEESISSEERITFAIYFLGTLTRVLRNRERENVVVPYFGQKAREITKETLHELASDSKDDQEKLEKLLKETSEGFTKIEKDLIKERSLPFFDEDIQSIF